MVESMKKYYIFALMMAVVTMMSLLACGDDDNITTSTEGKMFKQEVTLPAENAFREVTLTDLNSAIKGIDYKADWLTVVVETYTSGSPVIGLMATDNLEDGVSTSDRSCTVTITAKGGNSVLLSVKQEGVEISTGIDDSHDIPTDQPAYSRIQ